ncbi:MAG: hypothetical protein L3J10_00685 [Sulfurimonas sp.]|nr:hypothetical protein [Sulfurimonas sp.]
MKYILIVFIIFFSACSVKDYEQTKSKVIIIKSPKIKFADLGYIRNTGNNIQLELFLAGKSIKQININRLICVDEGCMSKDGFNADYLHESYPDDLLQHILLGLPIYAEKNKQKIDDGFTQKIENKDVNISYKVNSSTIYFKDKKNNIIFKIKEMKK